MMAQKWNHKKHDYDPYNLPEGCRLYDNNLSNPVACCQCGKKYEFGQMYTSKEIQSSVGFGYPVCEPCYEKEVKRDKKHR